MSNSQEQPQTLLQNETYLKILEIEQTHSNKRWNYVTFFMGIGFAILGFSFQQNITPSQAIALRLSGALVYWLAWFLYWRSYPYNRILRDYLLEMEEKQQTSLDLEKRARARSVGRGSFLNGYALLFFGMIYTIGIGVLWLFKL